MDVFVWLIYIILALMIGSFLTLVAIRIPIGESIIKPNSYCPSCKHSLTQLDMIPIIGYIGLKGTCRYCNSRIPIIYPLGELLTVLVFIMIPIFVGFNKEMVIAYTFGLIMITITISDIKYRIIPDKITLPGIVLLFILRLFIHPMPFWNYLVGALVFGGLLLLFAILSRGGMGGGDIKLFFLIGLALGWQNTLLALFLASLTGTLVGGVLLLLGRIKQRQLVPFGPFIFIGAMISYFFGNEIWDLYIIYFIN